MDNLIKRNILAKNYSLVIYEAVTGKMTVLDN